MQTKTNTTQEYEKVIQYIYEQMQDGTLRVGSRLPAERAIAEELGIGRNSTREALCTLHGMGLLTRVQGSGNYVSRNVGQSIRQTIQMMLALESISREEVSSFRRVMEQSVCNVLLEKGLTEEQKQKIEAQLEKMDHCKGEALVDADKAFHEALIAATENNLWMIIMEAVTEVYRGEIDYNLAHATEETRQKLIRSHRDIYQSLLKKDGAALQKAMKSHYL